MGQFDMCCVRYCKKRRDIDRLSLFKIPRQEGARRQAWLDFTQRKSEFRRSWMICSTHFVSGKASPDPTDVDFVPTLRPPQDIKKGQSDTGVEDEPPLPIMKRHRKSAANSLVEFNKVENRASEEEDVGTESDDSTARVKRRERKSFPCDLCGEQISSKQGLRCHMRKVHDQGGSTAARRSKKRYLSRNKSTPGTTKRGPLVCDRCGKVCKGTTALKEHMLNHLDVTPWHCGDCDKYFKKKNHLTKHLFSVHNKTPEHGAIPCPVCGKLFVFFSQLTPHMQSHCGPRTESLTPQQCPHCDKTFRHRCNLQNHIRGMHKGDKRLECSFCGKKFGNSYNLKTHFRLHTGEKPFVCTVCGKGYADSNNFRRHRQVCDPNAPKTTPLSKRPKRNPQEHYHYVKQADDNNVLAVKVQSSHSTVNVPQMSRSEMVWTQMAIASIQTAQF